MEPAKPIKFTVLGDAIVDVSVGPLDAFPTPGADVAASAIALSPGGSALNTAWHLAEQGVDAELRAAVGKDRAASVLTRALADESKLRDPSKSIATLNYHATASCVTIAAGAKTERAFVSSPGAARAATMNQLLPDGGDADALDATHVHVAGFYVCEGVHGGLAGVVRRLKSRGVVVSMDPNFDANGGWTNRAMKLAIKGPSAVDVLLPSEVEACEITGKPTAEEALDALLGVAEGEGGGKGSPDGVKLVVIKRGAAGVLAGDRDGGRWNAPACTVSRVVDTNGAGDAFNAGFLRSWASGAGVPQALNVGCAAAAIAAQHAGAVGAWAPSAAAVDALADAEYGDKPWWQQGLLACMAPRKLT